MLTVHGYTFEVASFGWPSHQQPAIDNVMVSLASEILHMSKEDVRKLHTQAQTRTAMERRIMVRALEVAAKVRPPRPPLPSPAPKPRNRPKPPRAEVKPTIRVIAR